MNKVILMGRLTKEVELKSSSKDESLIIARYTLAVNQGYGDKQRTDFINCVAFGKAGEFASKYFKKGERVLITGHLQTGKWTNKDNQKIRTVDVIVEQQEFAESRKGNTMPTKADFTSLEEERQEPEDELPFM